MSSTGYSAAIPANATTNNLVAATAKSILGVSGTSGFGVNLLGFKVSFDGTTASATPVLIELCAATFATNGPGTNSTTITPVQERGRTITPGFTAAYGWTAANEPTVLTVLESFRVTPNGGCLIYDYPLEASPDSPASNGFVIRCTTASVAVNVWGDMKFGRC
jgi:hypothetical protein